MDTQHTTTVGAFRTITIGAAKTGAGSALKHWGDPHTEPAPSGW